MIDYSHSTRSVPGIGVLALRPFEIARHAGCAHHWLTSPHARFWGMQSNTASQTIDYFAAIDAAATHHALIGLHDDTPAFLVEVYDPAAEAVGGHYRVEPGDAGLHILIAPPTEPVHGFTWAVFALTVDALFAQPAIDRLVVEPDVDNAGIHGLNQRAGFDYHRRLDLPGKTAWLATCTARGHAAAMAGLADEHAGVCGRKEITT